MKTKEFQEACHRLTKLFDGLVLEAEYGETEWPLTDFLYAEEYSELREMVDDDEKGNEIFSKIHDISSESFALGYLIGSHFEITYPEAQKDLGVIKDTIKKNQLLPFFPRDPRQYKLSLLRETPEKESIEKKQSNKKKEAA